MVTETKVVNRCKAPTHTLSRRSTWAPECSRTISIAAACANRLWQCFGGGTDWVGQVTFMQPCLVGLENTKKKIGSDASQSKHTTRSAARWKLLFLWSLNRRHRFCFTATGTTQCLCMCEKTSREWLNVLFFLHVRIQQPNVNVWPRCVCL